MRQLIPIAICLMLAACGGGGGGTTTPPTTITPPSSTLPTITAADASTVDFMGGNTSVVITVSAEQTPGLTVRAKIPALNRETDLVWSAGAFRGTLALPGNADASGAAKQWRVEAILSENGVERAATSTTAVVNAPMAPPSLP